MHCASVLLLVVCGLLSTASPAQGLESNFLIRNEEWLCLIFPDDSGFAVELAEIAERQRRTRIYIPPVRVSAEREVLHRGCRRKGAEDNSW